MEPLVSVIVPTYNAGDYLRQCMDSLVSQTYANLQIIAVNDGSTDGSLDVLRAYAARDARVQVIDKPNSGYGDSMNKGLAAASGVYVGIVEPDDYIDKRMYEAYVKAAEASGADIVKSNYYEHSGTHHDERLELFSACGVAYGEPFDPRDVPSVLTVRPSIWAGLYRRAFLVENGIDFAPTPGASFQDTSFCHMCWVAARKAVVLKQAYLHYRIDNESSSSNSSAKVYAACDEFARSLEFLKARAGQDLETFGPTLGAMRFGCYVWHYNRMASQFREGFAERWSREMNELYAEGLFDMDLLRPASLNHACLLMADPAAFSKAYPEMDWPDFAFGEEGLTTAKTPMPEADKVPLVDSAEISANPKVSVIIPLYNVEAYVRECIESLLVQTWKDFEAIVVDDGSTDHSLAMAKAAARKDVRFTFLQQDNAGQSKARNRAIEQARGEYLAFLDADDLYVPDALERLCTRAIDDGLDYLDFTAHTFYETPDMKRVNDEDYYENRTSVEGVMSGPELFVRYQRNDDYCCSLAMHFFKRSLLEDARLRFLEGVIHEDELFSPLLIAHAQRAAFANEQLYLRRVRANSTMTVKRGLRNAVCLLEVQRKLCAWMNAHLGENGAEFDRALAKRVAFLRRVIATDAEQAGDEELDAYEAGLTGEALVEFELLARGGLDMRRQAFADKEASLVYKVGDVLTKLPRAALHALRR